MMTQANIDAALRAWNDAARDLSITIVAPFTLQVDDRRHQCLVWVPYFSNRRGNLVIAAEMPRMLVDPVFKDDARRNGYTFSIVNVTDATTYDRTRFVDTLNEWGYYGPPEKCPSWCVEGNYSS